jgi:hypothetical protein
MRRFRSKRVPLRRSRKGRFGRSRPRASRKFSSGRYFKLVRTVNTGTVNVACNSGVPFTYEYQLNQIPDFANLKGLFDEYKISKVRTTFYPTADNAQVNNAGAGFYKGLGMIATALDYNSNTAPGSLAEVLEYRTRKLTKSSRIHSRTLSPKPQGPLYIGGIGSAYRPVANAWIPTEHVTVPHYALVGWLEGGSGDPAAYSYTCRIMTTYTVIFRAPR